MTTRVAKLCYHPDSGFASVRIAMSGRCRERLSGELLDYRGKTNPKFVAQWAERDKFPVTLFDYSGPSVFGYETDTLRRAASVSVHTSPLATLGGKDAGGMNVYVRELSCQIARLGLPVDIYTRRTDPITPEIVALCPGVNVISVTAGPAAPVDKNRLFELLPEFAAEAALFSLRNGVRYDVVHAHYWLSGWTAHLLKRYWETPFVQMFHTTAHMKNAVSPRAQHETALRLQVERKLVGLADSLIAANPDERADLIWRQRTRAEKICTVPPGVDVELFQPQGRVRSRQELGIDPDDRVVLFVGRVDPIKGIETFMEAIAGISRAGERVTILFVGGDVDGTGRPTGPLADVVAGAERLGIAQQFRFVGSQPQDRLPVFYSAADVVSVPSRYESFGLVAVEALACGTPVVASRVGGLTFTIEEGVNGFLVPPTDADALAGSLLSILRDSDLQRALGRNARISAERFAWPIVGSSILHVYQRLADGHRAQLCCDDEIYA